MSEDLTPVVPVEEQSVEISQSEANAAAQDIQKDEEEKVDYSSMGLKDIVDSFKEMLEEGNFQKLPKAVLNT